MHENEDISRIAANALCKCVLYISIAILAGITLSNCQLDNSIIEACQDACSSANSQMESVTQRECTCIEKGETATSWVIPRK